MNMVLDTLRKLQDVDGELYKLRQQQRQKPQELEAAQQKVAAQQVVVKTADGQLKTLQLKHKEKEIELSTKETQIKKLQGQLFQVKTNKEYTAMQHEIDQSKADISVLEEEILGLLDNLEQSRQAQAAEQATLSAQQDALKREQARVEQDLAAISGRIAQLDHQRQELTPGVERDSLSLYERILRSREGLALVPLVQESCGGCHMVQPPQIVNEVYLNAKLVTCNSCNRILYVNPADS
jgi:predicted  nucleic acid-binding Zn-ribbon protein